MFNFLYMPFIFKEMLQEDVKNSQNTMKVDP